MSRTLIALLVLLVAIAGGVAWYLMSTSKAVLNTPPALVTGTDIAPGQAIYTNGRYGFSVVYPETATVDYSFSPHYHLGSTWRANALSDATGTPIVAFITYQTESDHTYPRYFIAQVRIGASSDPKELAACEERTADQGETALPDVSLNGTIFKAFAFENAGMMQYARGVSYRALLNGSCIAIEKIQTGSSYREDPISPADIPDATLQAAYDALDGIVGSVTFVSPL